jgi:hypothetical protein
MVSLYFKELQKVNLTWKWIFFIGLYVLMLWALVEQFKVNGDIPATISILFSLIILMLFNCIVIVMRLDTKIDETGISYRFKPFHSKPREIRWDVIADFYLRDYKPLREFGGYGIQRRRGKGRAFTISGNKGLQLVLKDGKKILIGTQKPKELKLLIDKLK